MEQVIQYHDYFLEKCLRECLLLSPELLKVCLLGNYRRLKWSGGPSSLGIFHLKDYYMCMPGSRVIKWVFVGSLLSNPPSVLDFLEIIICS